MPPFIALHHVFSRRLPLTVMALNREEDDEGEDSGVNGK